MNLITLDVKNTNLKPENEVQKIKQISIPSGRNREIRGQFRQALEIFQS